MKESSNFKDLFRRVSLYLDNELSTRESQQLIQEINQNPQYYSVLNKEKCFREFVKSRAQRKSVSPNLIQSIKSRILSAEVEH